MTTLECCGRRGLLSSPSITLSSGCYKRIPSTGWHKQIFILTVLEARSIESRCQRGWALGEVFLPGLQPAGQPSFYCMVTWQVYVQRREGEGEGEGDSSPLSLLIKAFILSWGVYSHNLLTSQRPYHPQTTTLGIRVSIYEFWGATNIQAIATTLLAGWNVRCDGETSGTMPARAMPWGGRNNKTEGGTTCCLAPNFQLIKWEKYNSITSEP